MLVPGIRLIERPGALHMFDGRRVVSIAGEDDSRAAVLAALGMRTSAVDDATVEDAAVDDARRLLSALRLIVAEPDASASSQSVRTTSAAGTSADYVSAATAGWVPAAQAAHRLRSTTVHVLGPSAAPMDANDGAADMPEGALLSSLAATGIHVARLADPELIALLDPARDVVTVVGADDNPSDLLVSANLACVQANIPLLPIGGYDGSRMHVGPLVIPHQSACLDCMTRRAAANVTYPDLFEAVLAAPVAPTPPALRQWAAAVAAMVLLHWIGDMDVRIPGRLFTLVPDELLIRQAVVHRVPRCRVCSAPDFELRAAPWETARDH
jgi:bacteriocin biosynthesis cyclodehydratase domain-containing protein